MTFKRPAPGILLAALLLSPAAGAAAAADDVNVRAHYGVYLHGLHVLDASVAYTLSGSGYSAETHIVPAGIASLFLKMDIISAADGRFTADHAVTPLFFDSAGYSREKKRHVRLSYVNAVPRVDVIEPPEPNREPVPADQLNGAVDTLSGMARLIRTVSRTHQCNGGSTVFDGLRLTRMTFKGPFEAQAPSGRGQVYAGLSLRCDFVGQQIAGFVRNSPNRAKLATPQGGSVWFHETEGFGLVPVRVEFDHPKIGHVTVVLQKPVTR